MTLIFFSDVKKIDARIPISINGISKSMTPHLSCQASQWGNNQNSSCRCCLVKNYLDLINKQKNNDDASISGIFNYCRSKNQCNMAIEKQIASEEGFNQGYTYGQLAQSIYKKSALISPVQLDNVANTVTDSQLDEQSVLAVLGELVVQNPTPELNDVGNYLQKGCLVAEKISEGGKKTGQLFKISIKGSCNVVQQNQPLNNTQDQPFFILKEMKAAHEETLNLAQVQNTPLNEYSLSSTKRNQSDLAIAFPIKNFQVDLNRKRLKFSLIPIASGVSYSKLIKDFADIFVKDPTQGYQASTLIMNSFSRLGEVLGRVHYRFVSPRNGKITGLTRVHGDLHLNNVFIDTNNGQVTLIDNETFVYSLRTAQPISRDLIMIYGYPTFHLQASYRKPDTIDDYTWHEIMFKPFIRGYVQSYPKELQYQVIYDLKQTFLDSNVFGLLLRGDRPFFNPVRFSQMKERFIKPFLLELEMEILKANFPYRDDLNLADDTNSSPLGQPAVASQNSGNNSGNFAAPGGAQPNVNPNQPSRRPLPVAPRINPNSMPSQNRVNVTQQQRIISNSNMNSNPSMNSSANMHPAQGMTFGSPSMPIQTN